MAFFVFGESYDKRKKKLTVKQQKFADCYEGNATKAARKAGYTGKDNVLAATASRLLRNVKVSAAIQKRQEEEKSALIASRIERMEILSSILRNKKACELPAILSGAEIGETLEGERKIVKIEVVDKDKIRAIDTLNKMDGLYIQKLEFVDGLNVTITRSKEKKD